MKIDRLPIFLDQDGVLVPVEFSRLPFRPQRMFYVTAPKGELRGDHAHFNCKQYLICAKGKIVVGLYDGIVEIKKVLWPGEGVFVDRMVWDNQVFVTGDDLLIVLSSMPYDKNDYIENKDEFKKLIRFRK